jgi:hypothetical protein
MKLPEVGKEDDTNGATEASLHLFELEDEASENKCDSEQRQHRSTSIALRYVSVVGRVIEAARTRRASLGS